MYSPVTHNSKLNLRLSIFILHFSPFHLCQFLYAALSDTVRFHGKDEKCLLTKREQPSRNTSKHRQTAIDCLLQSMEVHWNNVNRIHTYIYIYTHRVSQEECTRLRENVPYVKVHRYNPKHLYPKLNCYGDNGERKVWSSCGSTYCTCFACCYSYTAHVRPPVSQPS